MSATALIFAYRLVDAIHSSLDVADIPSHRPPDFLTQAVAYDYVRAGLQFLAESFPDSRLNRLAVLALDALASAAIEVVAAANMMQEAIRHGMPPLLAARWQYPEGRLHLLVSPEQEYAALLTPLLHIVQARAKPALALAEVSRAASLLVDFANHRMQQDRQYARMRADAALAHFWLAAAPEKDSPYDELLASFPKGLDSLPEEVRYQPRSPSVEDNDIRLLNMAEESE